MTDDARDPIADWHAQFAPAPAAAAPGQPRPELGGQVAAEHFADADGVFTAAGPKPEVAAEPVADPKPKKDEN